MKKRLVYLILCLVLIFGLMPAASFADDVTGEDQAVEITVETTADNSADQNDVSDTEFQPESVETQIEPEITIAPAPTAADSQTGFTDVTADDWFYDDVNFAVENGLMNGVGDNLFDPNGNITRGMFATILYRLEGEPAFMNDNTYTDVAPGSYYEKAIIWCSSGKTNIVQGYGDNLFGPDDNITREQLAKMLYNYASYKGLGFQGAWMFLLDYNDASAISSWADEAMHWCSMNGLITGFETGNIEPQGTATRAQAAKILSMYVQKFGDSSVSPYAGDYTNAAGDRLSFDDNGDGTLTAYSRLIPENASAVDGMKGTAYPIENGLEIDFTDPYGNHITAKLLAAANGYGYDLTITGSFWEEIESGEVFKGFIKQ